MLVKAYAKINFGLHIVRKREDGYHELQTIFHRVNIFDEITFSKKDHGISLHSNLPYIPTDKKNLCVRAAELIVLETGYEQGIQIHLKKTIPVSGGLGGGSSDAAAVLLHLPEFLEIDIEKKRLQTFAESLGSDVPFFLESKSAYATGRGEILDYFELVIPYAIVIVQPPVRISTRWAYKHLKINSDVPQFDLKQFVLTNMKAPVKFVNELRNDFESVVFDHKKEVQLVKEAMYQSGALFALMSGSGSCVFGLYLDERSAHHAKKLFPKNYATFITQPYWKP